LTNGSSRVVSVGRLVPEETNHAAIWLGDKETARANGVRRQNKGDEGQQEDKESEVSSRRQRVFRE